MSYSSAAYLSQSVTSWPSDSTSCKTQKPPPADKIGLDPTAPTDSAPTGGRHPAHPDDGEGVLLLVVQVLLDVEEGVEEDVGQLAPLQVAQGDPSCEAGEHMAQNLRNRLLFRAPAERPVLGADRLERSSCTASKVAARTQPFALRTNFSPRWRQRSLRLQLGKTASAHPSC